MAKDPNPNPLTFERLLELSDLRQVELTDVPRWSEGGVTVVIRELSAAELFHNQAECTDKEGKLDTAALGKANLQAALVEPRLSRDQIEALFARSSEPILYIGEQVNKLNKSGTPKEAVSEEIKSFRE